MMCQVEISIRTPNFDPKPICRLEIEISMPKFRSETQISFRTSKFHLKPKFRSQISFKFSFRNRNFDPKPKFRSKIELKFHSEIEISSRNRNFDVVYVQVAEKKPSKFRFLNEISISKRPFRFDFGKFEFRIEIWDFRNLIEIWVSDRNLGFGLKVFQPDTFIR